MPKIDVSKVAEILKKNALEPALLRRLIEELNLAVQPDPDGEEKPDAVKKQFVILVSDPEGRLKSDALESRDLTGWVLQIPEDASPVTTEERIQTVASTYNTTKKGRLYPAKTIAEAMENIKRGAFEESDIWVKTKLPVQVLRTDNELPRE